MITDNEKQLVGRAILLAQEAGAQKVRASYLRSEEDLVSTLNGEVDRVTHCADRSLSLSLFVDKRYGAYSTNKLDDESLRDFIYKCVGITRMLTEDKDRDLPKPERCCTTAVGDDLLDVVDPYRIEISPNMRQSIALKAAIFGTPTDGSYAIVSEEAEYSDGLFDTIIMDSNGVCCIHSETSFDYGVEITIEADGEKYSSYWWDSNAHFSELNPCSCGKKALEMAVGQIGSCPMDSGKYNMVVSSEVASKFVSPILRALNGFAIQQHNSFLLDSLGKQIFPEQLNILDQPWTKGHNCSKLFDSEGVASKPCSIIENGKVNMWFINTYMAAKLNMQATIEEAIRPYLAAWPKPDLKLEEILAMSGSGIYVTSFNGGNSNSVSGDFSYGIEGYWFENGKIVRPVSEMLVTGNLLSLWQNFFAAGSDARSCMSKLIPTLAFSDVDFSG